MPPKKQPAKKQAPKTPAQAAKANSDLDAANALILLSQFPIALAPSHPSQTSGDDCSSDTTLELPEDFEPAQNEMERSSQTSADGAKSPTDVERSHQPESKTSVHNQVDGASKTLEKTEATSMAQSEEGNPTQPKIEQKPQPADIQQPRRGLHPDNALQAYLVRQQFLAGIAPENMIRMRDRDPTNRQVRPALLQICNNSGIQAPILPAPRFTGPFHPLIELKSDPGPSTAPQVQPATGGDGSINGGSRARSASEPRSVPTDFHDPRPAASNDERVEGCKVEPGIETRSGASSSGEDSHDIPDDDNAHSNFQHSADAETREPHNGSIHHSHSTQFDILNEFVNHPELALRLSELLEARDLINLYAISKPFHNCIKAHLRTIMTRQIKSRISSSSRIFPFACYPKLSIEAIGTVPNNQPNLSPSLLWLSMIDYRESGIKEIMSMMTDTGYAVPKKCARAIKKLWFLMDIPDNKRREWTVRNQNLWENIDLFMATFFIVQMDKCIRHKRGNESGALRRLIMAQPSLTFLRNVLNDTVLTNEFDVLRAFVRYQYTPEPGENGEPILGVPGQQVGRLQYERYGREENSVRLRRPDDLVVGEMSRRNLTMQQMYNDIFLLEQEDKWMNALRKDASWDEEIRLEFEDAEGKWLDMLRLM